MVCVVPSMVGEVRCLNYAADGVYGPSMVGRHVVSTMPLMVCVVPSMVGAVRCLDYAADGVCAT